MSVKYQHLLGRPFVFGETDCYSAVRDFYTDNYGIVLPNYARPSEFWKHGMNMYADRYLANGFVSLDCHPSEYQEGDVFLMAINATVGNHAGVLVDGGRIFQHLWARLSSADPYRGVFRNSTVGVFRHKDVVVEKLTTTTNIEDIKREMLRAN